MVCGAKTLFPKESRCHSLFLLCFAGQRVLDNSVAVCAWAVSWPLVPRIFQVPVPPHLDASIKELALEKKG